MFGSFRLLLAVLVALSHAGVRLGELNPGVMAVVGFYLISGYVMTGLLRRYYTSLRAVPSFYLDRALRIYPQYLAIAAVTLLWFQFSGARTDFLQHAPGAGELLNNLLIAPLNYYMFNQADQYTLIPPAWSLGAEIQFYLVFPFVLLLPHGRALLLPTSLAIYLCAASGMIPTEWYGYRLLPGVLFLFLLGSWLHDHHVAGGRRASALVAATLATAALLAMALNASGRLELPYNRETLLGLALGLPALHHLARLSRRAWDEALGDLSYGVFLAHFLILWLFFGKVEGNAETATYLVLTLATAHLTQRLVERPALHLRHKLRRRE